MITPVGKISLPLACRRGPFIDSPTHFQVETVTPAPNEVLSTKSTTVHILNRKERVHQC